MHLHAIACNCMQLLAFAYKCMQLHAFASTVTHLLTNACKYKHFYNLHANTCNCMHMHTLACKCMQLHAYAHNSVQLHAIACKSMQMHRFACICTQLHLPLVLKRLPLAQPLALANLSFGMSLDSKVCLWPGPLPQQVYLLAGPLVPKSSSLSRPSDSTALAV